MSSHHADAQAFHTEKTARLEAQLEVQHLKSAIRKLEQEVDALKADKRPSAGKPDGRAVQVEVSTSSSDAALRAEVAQLQEQIAARDAIIAQQGEEKSALLENMTRYQETMAALTLGMTQDITAAKQREAQRELTPRVSVTDTDKSAEHQPQKESMPEVSVIDTDKSAEPISTSAPKGFRGDTRTRHHTISPGLTAAKFPADSTPKQTVASQPDYAQVLRTPREKPSTRRAERDFTLMPLTLTHAASAKRKAEQAPFEPQKQQKFDLGGAIVPRPTPKHQDDSSDSDAGVRSPFGYLDRERGKLRGFGGLRGRGSLVGRGGLIGCGDLRERGGLGGRGDPRGHGDHRGHGDQRPNQGSTAQSLIEDANPAESSRKAGPESTEVMVPANLEKRAELKVTNTPEGMNQPSLKPHVDISVATSKVQAGQENLVDKNKKSSEQPSEHIDLPPGWTLETVEAYKFFGQALPWEEDTAKADMKRVAPPVPTTPPSTSKNVERDPGSSNAIKLSSLESQAIEPAGPAVRD